MRRPLDRQRYASQDGQAALVRDWHGVLGSANSLITFATTLIIAISAGAMVIVAKIMLALMFGIGPFFIAMLMFPATAKWFDSWFGQMMTYLMQIALVTTVLGMGMKFFSAPMVNVPAVTAEYPNGKRCLKS